MKKHFTLFFVMLFSVTALLARPVNEAGANANTFALIITNYEYAKPLPSVPFANNDGEIFYQYCVKTLSIPENQQRTKGQRFTIGTYRCLDPGRDVFLRLQRGRRWLCHRLGRRPFPSYRRLL